MRVLHRPTDVDDLAGAAAALHCCTNAWVAKKTPLRFTLRTASKSFLVTSQKAACLSIPALLIRMSRPPSASALRAHELANVTDATQGFAPAITPRRPSARQCSATTSSAPSRIAVVVDDDVGALLREASGDAAADALAAASDGSATTDQKSARTDKPEQS